MDVDRRSLLGMMAGAAALAALPILPPPAHAADIPDPDFEDMIPVPGGRVYVRVNGDLKGPNPPLVILHGGPGGVHISYLTALALADERAVILYDQLDSGRSDHPENPANWRVPRFVEEAEAVRRGLKVNRWHLLGHSWGGTIALEYGARRPRALAGLVLASPLVSTRSWIADADALRRQLPADVQQVLRDCDPPRPVTPACEPATQQFYAAFNGRMKPTAEQMAYYQAHSGKGFNPKIYNAMWGSSEFVSTGSLKDYDGEPLLAKLDGRRTLFLCGQYDEARPATLLGFAGRVPDCEFGVVPGAAHGIFTDRPTETLGLLRPWLRRQDALAKG